MNPWSCVHLIFDKGAKNIWWRKASSMNVAGKIGSACRKLKLDLCLSPCTSINLTWIKVLDIRPQILKLVQEKAGNTLEAIGIGKDFFRKHKQLSN
jgi:hypothetical protein